MSGSNNGTGYRITARCFWCAQRYAHRARRGYDVQPTGRREYRPKYSTTGIRSDVFYRYEQRCSDCGRTSWTRHMDIAQRWAARFQPTNGTSQQLPAVGKLCRDGKGAR